MPLSQITRAFIKSSGQRLYQGDVYRDLTVGMNQQLDSNSDDLLVTEYPLRYCVLITQDCDLEQDYNNRTNSNSATHDKYIFNLLVLPAYPAEQLRRGTQFKYDDDDDSQVMRSMNTTEWRNITSNQNIRYHYIIGDDDLQIPNMTIDFKHYTTLPRDYLYKKAKESYRGTITALYRENISYRFAHYLSRIALPDLPLQPAIQT